MKLIQEFEFICRESNEVGAAETVKRFTTDGCSYSDVVDAFLLFLSSAYGYSITLDDILGGVPVDEFGE